MDKLISLTPKLPSLNNSPSRTNNASGTFGIVNILNSEEAHSSPTKDFEEVPEESNNVQGMKSLHVDTQELAPMSSIMLSAPSSANTSPQASSYDSKKTTPTQLDDDDGVNDEENNSITTNASKNDSSYRGGRWTNDEHERFLEGFRIHGHKWKRVQHVVKTRSVTQVRTHAQKYLLKLQKSKTDKAIREGLAAASREDGNYLDRGTSSSPRKFQRNRDEEIFDRNRRVRSRLSFESHEISPQPVRRDDDMYLLHENQTIEEAAKLLCYLMNHSYSQQYDDWNSSDSSMNSLKARQQYTESNYPYEKQRPNPAYMSVYFR